MSAATPARIAWFGTQEDKDNRESPSAGSGQAFDFAQDERGTFEVQGFPPSRQKEGARMGHGTFVGRPALVVGFDCEPRCRSECRAWFPLVSNLMKQETHAEIRGKGLRGQGNFPRRHYPDRVLGYFLSPIQLEHPCFNNPIETLPARFGKCFPLNSRALRAKCAIPCGAHGAPGSAPERIEEWAIGIELRHIEATNLCRIVGATQHEGLARVRKSEEDLRLRSTHRAALQGKALHRRRR